MSENPAHPDAPPTAPGGMSRDALVAELIDEHGYVADSDWDGVSWPDLIDMVVAERLEAEADPHRFCDHDNDHCQANVDEADQPIEDEDEDDPEVEAEELAEELAEAEIHGPDDDLTEYDSTEALTPMLDDPVFPSAKRMFTDEGTDPMIDNEAVDLLETLLPLLEDIAEMGEAAMDEAFGGDIMDPEAVFEEMFAARAEVEASQPAPLFLGIPGVRDYIFDGHAGAGPSGAERWMNCTMSLSASRKFLETLSPNQQREFARSGTAARQGTTAHAAAEVEANHLLGRVDIDEVEMTLLELTIDPEHETEAYDSEMADYVGEYVDLVKSYAQERGADAIGVEDRVEAAIPLSGVHEGEVYIIRGSADLTVLPVKKHKSLVVGDLKYGEGLDVDVESNPQIRLYALGVLGDHVDEEGNLPAGWDTVEYIIAQPRLGGIKRWSESVDDLLTWRDEVLSPALTKAIFGAPEGATYEPSDLACQWCPARGGCPALAEAVVENSASMFEAMSEAEFEGGPGAILETTTLSPDRLGELLKLSEDVDKLRKSLREEAQRRLHRGEGVPGYHLVNYSPPRHWAEGAEEKIAHEVSPAVRAKLFTEPSLLSPPQAEKVLGKEGFPAVVDLVVKPEPVPVIGRTTDRRKAWAGQPPEAMFADESSAETGDE